MTSVLVIAVTKYTKETTEGSESYFGSQVHASEKALTTAMSGLWSQELMTYCVMVRQEAEILGHKEKLISP